MKWLLGLLSLLTSNKLLAASTTGALAGANAAVIGLDPIPWVCATAGMVYMLSRSEYDDHKTDAKIRLEAVGNGLVSLLGGGLGGPLAAIAVAEYVNPALSSPWFMAFFIAAFWQVLAYKALPEVWSFVRQHRGQK